MKASLSILITILFLNKEAPERTPLATLGTKTRTYGPQQEMEIFYRNGNFLPLPSRGTFLKRHEEPSNDQVGPHEL
jgi:hypothetical protein